MSSKTALPYVCPIVAGSIFSRLSANTARIHTINLQDLALFVNKKIKPAKCCVTGHAPARTIGDQAQHERANCSGMVQGPPNDEEFARETGYKHAVRDSEWLGPDL